MKNEARVIFDDPESEPSRRRETCANIFSPIMRNVALNANVLFSFGEYIPRIVCIPTYLSAIDCLSDVLNGIFSIRQHCDNVRFRDKSKVLNIICIVN